MNRNPVLLKKIFVVGIIVLFLGVAVQTGLAKIKTDSVSIELSFHDVGIKNINSPTTPWKSRTKSLTYGPLWSEVFIQPGTEDIDVTIVNNGTFPEYDLTCYAEIYEYITDPDNGTLVYEDEIINIDLEEPNGGTKLLNFDDYTFANEGIYILFIDLPLEIDDYPENNHKELTIGVDDTNPDCDYPPILDPPEPNGWNGWYISDVTVTLNASDPLSKEVSSGVKEIRYTIDGGAEQIINGNHGSFFITDDGNDILVEYWAVDYVGNVESTKNSFTIDIDKTCPDASITYEIIGWTPLEGWEFQITVIATDDISGICRIELYFNDEFIEVWYGSGPEYVWTFFYDPSQGNVTIKVIVYDCAGNITIIEFNPKTSSHIIKYLWLFDRFPLLERLLTLVL